jgi:glutamine synthetase
MRDGVTMTSTLLAKDTSHRNVFSVFASGGGMDVAEMEARGTYVMVADPATFPRVAVGGKHRLGAARHLFRQR